MNSSTAEAAWSDVGVAAGEVRLWWVALEVAPEMVERLERNLADDERARAARFVFARDRRRYVVAHAALRHVLARCLGRPAAELTFAVGANGKPSLAAAADRWLCFNLSHSHEAALIACAREREVGVDLEWQREDVALEEMAASTFSTAELQEWQALPMVGRRAGFFHGWVRKEAYVKALGAGLSHPTGRYTVRLAPEGSAALLADELQPEAVTQWSILALSVPAGYAAAVAVAGPVPAVKLTELKAGDL
ncbi:MAG: 4'-phosphopantetheinyl transferase superfamily protein [Verrucomicrobia bacterium]|nr:4'-phosphopantetheinyl transferase superfamily protein [Verrucomicrobiota bacterium]